MYLTNKRIVFYKVSFATRFLLGALSGYTRGSVEELNIPIYEIIDVSEKRQGLGKKYVFNTERDKFSFIFKSEPDLWIKRIIGALRGLGKNVEGNEHAFKVK